MSNEADVSYPESLIDIGEIWESKRATIVVPLHNGSSRSLEILDVYSDCRCHDISPKKFTIPAHGQVNLSFNADLSSRLSIQQELSRRKLSLTFRLLIEGGRPRVYKVEGTILSRLTLSESHTHFGDNKIRGSDGVTRQVIVQSHVPCDGLEIINSNDHLRTRCDKIGLDRYRISITAIEPKMAGPFSTLLPLKVVTEGIVQDSGMEITVDGAWS